MLTEHSVTYEIPGGERVITRVIYAPDRSQMDRRIMGTETTSDRVYRGYDGWRITESCTETHVFGHISEAQKWMDVMLSDWQVSLTQGTGAKPNSERMSPSREEWAEARYAC